MKVHFKFPRAIDGKDFSKGTHEVSDEKSNHWFLQALVKNGDAVILEGKESPKEEKEPEMELAEIGEELKDESSETEEPAEEKKKSRKSHKNKGN